MHTATEIQTNMLVVEENGATIDATTLLEMGDLDRFGIVIRSPFGALGAGLLLSLAITSFYDVRGKDRRARNLYPEIYLFHVGGPWGCHSAFDFWPEGKELFLPDDPVEVLRAINRHGITHLAVPDTPGRQVLHGYREPEIAAERIKHCFSYHASGSVEVPDILIRTTSQKVIWNYAGTLRPELYIDDMEQSLRTDPALQAQTAMAKDYRRVIHYLRQRWDEISRTELAYLQAEERIARAQTEGHLEESFLRIDVAQAISMLA